MCHLIVLIFQYGLELQDNESSLHPVMLMEVTRITTQEVKKFIHCNYDAKNEIFLQTVTFIYVYFQLLIRYE